MEINYCHAIVNSYCGIDDTTMGTDLDLALLSRSFVLVETNETIGIQPANTKIVASADGDSTRISINIGNIPGLTIRRWTR